MFIITMTCSLAFAKPTENVETFLKSCYKDYVIAFASTKDSEKLGAKVRQNCLSKEFNQLWFKIISKADADAMLVAQDYQESWKSNIEVKDLNESKSTAKVILGKNTEQHCLNITYIKEPDLKIDDVAKCKAGNLK